jgi:hypothetical protein
LQFGLRLVDQLELAVGYVGVGEHSFNISYHCVFLILVSFLQ